MPTPQLEEGWLYADTNPRAFQVAVSHPFGLLANVGQDIPGAMRIVTGDDAGRSRDGDVLWLAPADVAARLRAVR